MFSLFSDFASWLVYSAFGLDANTRIGASLHFFVEDTTKIFFLLIVMIYVVAILRASLNVEKVRDYLSRRHTFIGYIMGSIFGAVTPFCSCSSIPVFLGFISAGIPVGITMAFLITSPLINEVAVILLVGLVGWKITAIYIFFGVSVGILGGMFLDVIRAERWLQPFVRNAYRQAGERQAPVSATPMKLTLQERHRFAKQELSTIFSRVWKWVFIGVGLGAALHGLVPDTWIAAHLGQGQWWSVPVAVLVGIPLYANATGVIPVMESLIVKGLPLGTTMAFCMSTVAASFPEFVLLKQVMQWKLLITVFVLLLFAFTLIGWALNLISFN
uniref:Permease n=1 Tax=Candidatus Kentrum sp. DK TaxID=2126562 RepID=A0A450T5M6_9GAMM|nr:MAG: hypothetical protein BECKDK2373B_GA0170837_11071 [Candidatus Kentron sp. DK]